MPSYTPPSSSLSLPKRDFQTLLDAARPFLRGELESVDPDLPGLVTVLRSVGAGECSHKHGTFFEHLIGVYRILKLWSAPDAVARFGLLHSAYSNSYVNLAIFDRATSRSDVRRLIGEPAERLVHLFCVVPRKPLIHDDLLFLYSSDEELVEHLALSAVSLQKAKKEGEFDAEEHWRRKLQSVLPANGITVENIKTGEEMRVSRRVVAVFLMMTMADFCDQMFGWQDALFKNANGRLEFGGSNHTALWPGSGKPGLWMNSISRMGALYTLILREEEIYLEERKRGGGSQPEDRDEEIELVIPPVFDNCTRVLSTKDQKEARDLYWEAVCKGEEEEDGGLKIAEELLPVCTEKNPFVGEPHVILGQVYLSLGRFEEAEREAEKGLRLMLEWGTCWDKRMTWEGWIAWGRILLANAKERTWPQSSKGIINLGLVR